MVFIKTKKGIDISSWQGIIDFEKVKTDGIDFAIIRCGYGSNLLSQDDKFFEANVRGCERAGIDWGLYLYSYARNLAEAQSEVDHVLRLIKGKKPTYPVYIDMEDADGYKLREKVTDAMCSQICELFCRKIRQAGYLSGIYANKYWLENKLDAKMVASWDTWLAQWTKEPTYQKRFEMWQYTSGGAVSGINGRVDMNLCYVDYPEKIKSLGLNGFGSEVIPEKDDSVSKGRSFKVGDKVRYGGRLYSDSYGTGEGKQVDGIFLISRIVENRKCGILLENGLGWVSADMCELMSDGDSNITFKKGDRVRIRNGVSRFFDGVLCAQFLLNALLYVREVKIDRILVSILSSGAVTGWFKPQDLILV